MVFRRSCESRHDAGRVFVITKSSKAFNKIGAAPRDARAREEVVQPLSLRLLGLELRIFHEAPWPCKASVQLLELLGLLEDWEAEAYERRVFFLAGGATCGLDTELISKRLSNAADDATAAALREVAAGRIHTVQGPRACELTYRGVQPLAIEEDSVAESAPPASGCFDLKLSDSLKDDDETQLDSARISPPKKKRRRGPEDHPSFLSSGIPVCSQDSVVSSRSYGDDAYLF